MKRGIDIIRAMLPGDRTKSLNERLLGTIWDYEQREADKLAQMQRDLSYDIQMLDWFRYHFTKSQHGTRGIEWN